MFYVKKNLLIKYLKIKYLKILYIHINKQLCQILNLKKNI